MFSFRILVFYHHFIPAFILPQRILLLFNVLPKDDILLRRSFGFAFAEACVIARLFQDFRQSVSIQQIALLLVTQASSRTSNYCTGLSPAVYYDSLAHYAVKIVLEFPLHFLKYYLHEPCDFPIILMM